MTFPFSTPLLPYVSIDLRLSHQCEHALSGSVLLLRLKKKNFIRFLTWQSVTTLAKGKSPATVSGPSPGTFDPKQLQVFLKTEYLLFYEPQPIKFLSPDVSGMNENLWGQFGFIPYSLTSNRTMLQMIQSAFGFKISLSSLCLNDLSRIAYFKTSIRLGRALIIFKLSI